jgi:hypothetical protein
MYQDTRRHCTFTLTVLLSIQRLNAKAGTLSTSDDILHPSPEWSVQHPAEGGKIIVVKPLENPPIDNPAFEDYVHIVVACTLALVLATLLGLFIRHFGLTLPSLTSPERSRSNRAPAGDTENDPKVDGGRGVVGIGIDKWEKEGVEGLRALPERPAAVHLKWG